MFPALAAAAAVAGGSSFIYRLVMEIYHECLYQDRYSDEWTFLLRQAGVQMCAAASFASGLVVHGRMNG